MSRLRIAFAIALVGVLCLGFTPSASAGSDTTIRVRSREVQPNRRVVFVAANPATAAEAIEIEARIYCRTPRGAVMRTALRTVEPGERIRVRHRTPIRGTDCTASIVATADDPSQARLTIRPKRLKSR